MPFPNDGTWGRFLVDLLGQFLVLIAGGAIFTFLWGAITGRRQRLLSQLDVLTEHLEQTVRVRRDYLFAFAPCRVAADPPSVECRREFMDKFEHATMALLDQNVRDYRAYVASLAFDSVELGRKLATLQRGTLKIQALLVDKDIFDGRTAVALDQAMALNEKVHREIAAIVALASEETTFLACLRYHYRRLPRSEKLE